MKSGLVNRYLALVLCVLFSWSGVCQAGAAEEYREAHEVFIAAAACLATYNDRYGNVAASALKEDGWKVMPYEHKGKYADARFFLAEKQFPGEVRPFYLLAVTGTENSDDVKVDLRWGKVPFDQNEEANDLKSKEQESLPMVHMGFYQYGQTAAEAEVIKAKNGVPGDLLKQLTEHPDQKIYLVGHSLGGAVVTIGGAKLLEYGVHPDQIKVITFGAPAVGNEAFKDLVAPKLNLLRVTTQGDPIPTVLRDIPGGYVQFGREIHWDVPDMVLAHPHSMTVYLDLALKGYYQARQQTLAAGGVVMPLEQRRSNPQVSVYLAPLRLDLPASLAGEGQYMEDVLHDEYRDFLTDAVFDKTVEDERTVLAKAKMNGYDYVIIPQVHASLLKDGENKYGITVEQRFYRVFDNHLISQDVFSTSTENITPLEGFFQAIKDTRSKYQQIISK